MKVWPRTEDLRKVLRHPTAGIFRAAGPGDWPDDTYTFRSIRDGDVVTEDPAASPSKAPTATAPAKSSVKEK